MLRASTKQKIDVLTLSKRARVKKRLVICFAVIGIFFSGFFYLEWSRSPLPDPELVFPSEGILQVLEVDRFAIPQLNQVIASTLDYAVEVLAYRGIEIEVPQFLRAAILRSDPWRVAVWEDRGSRRRGMLFGGEGFGRARARWLDEVVARGVPSRDGLIAAELGGAVLFASETSLTTECQERFDGAKKSWIETKSVRFCQTDYVTGVEASVELLSENAGYYLREQFSYEDRFDSHALRSADRFSSIWKEVLEYFGIAVEIVTEESNTETRLPETRLWLISDLEVGLRELLLTLRE